MIANTAQHAATLLVMFAVLPAWVLAGLTDYLCHRATHIEENAGVTESVLHLVQFSLVAIPTTLALLVQVNTLFFLVAAIAILLHHAVAFIDVSYANPRRRVTPFEQMVHSFLEIMPITAFLLLAVLHWPDLLALAGHPAAPGGWGFRLKDHPLPLWYVVAAVGAAALFNALPYLEELIRCLRQRAQASEGIAP